MRLPAMVILAAFPFLSCGPLPPIPQDCRLLGCGAGLVCTEDPPGTWSCKAPPPCSEENPCPDGEVCVGGKCEPNPPWACSLPFPSCEETGQTCSDPPEARCWHNPTADPDHCEEAPVCAQLPQPQCTAADACDCWLGEVWRPCPDPPQTGCSFNTPTAEWMIANGYRCEVRVKREGRKGVASTPWCANWPDVNGEPYYCQPGLWPERCAEGKPGGPVAPDGHPARPACEARFLQQPCATFRYESNTHMSFDPWICIHEEGQATGQCTNQNHPRNVRVCGQGKFETHPSWEKDAQGYIKAGQWSWATAHGNGTVCAEARGGVAKSCVAYVEP